MTYRAMHCVSRVKSRRKVSLYLGNGATCLKSEDKIDSKHQYELIYFLTQNFLQILSTDDSLFDFSSFPPFRYFLVTQEREINRTDRRYVHRRAASHTAIDRSSSGAANSSSTLVAGTEDYNKIENSALLLG